MTDSRNDDGPTSSARVTPKVGNDTHDEKDRVDVSGKPGTIPNDSTEFDDPVEKKMITGIQIVGVLLKLVVVAAIPVPVVQIPLFLILVYTVYSDFFKSKDVTTGEGVPRRNYWKPIVYVVVGFIVFSVVYVKWIEHNIGQHLAGTWTTEYEHNMTEAGTWNSEGELILRNRETIELNRDELYATLGQIAFDLKIRNHKYSFKTDFAEKGEWELVSDKLNLKKTDVVFQNGSFGYDGQPASGQRVMLISGSEMRMESFLKAIQQSITEDDEPVVLEVTEIDKTSMHVSQTLKKSDGKETKFNIKYIREF